MKILLAITAAGEAAMGLALLAYPPIVIRLLFGAEISGAGILVSHVAGVGGMAAGPDEVPFLGRRQEVNEVSVADEAQHTTQGSWLRRSFLPSVKCWLREPLVHFLLIGAVRKATRVTITEVSRLPPPEAHQ